MNRYQIKSIQSATQARSIQQRSNLPLNTIATTIGRDPVTGDRLMQAPDGGDLRQKWITNSAPDPIPPVAIASSVIGLPGFSTQRPT